MLPLHRHVIPVYLVLKSASSNVNMRITSQNTKASQKLRLKLPPTLHFRHFEKENDISRDHDMI